MRKYELEKKIENIPFAGVCILYIYKMLKLFFYYKPIFALNSFRNSEVDIFKKYFISPDSINYVSEEYFNKKIDIGRVYHGDWDLSRKWFCNTIVYRSLSERFCHNYNWEDTEYYKFYSKKIRSGKMPAMCKNEKELKIRLKNLDALFKQIKKKGFIEDIDKRVNVFSYKGKILNKVRRAHNFLDYIRVDINRNGVPLFVDGRHRLSIAKILKVEKVPVIIRVRHKQWVKFKNEIREYAKNEPGEKLYQKAYHFDLEDIPYLYGEREIDLIKENSFLKSGTVLDIDAYFGFNCHILEKAGFDCYAIESNIKRKYFMEKLKNANGDKFKILNESVFDFKKTRKLRYDIIIALDFFDNFIKNAHDFRKLKETLARFCCKEMYISVQDLKKLNNKSVYRDNSPEKLLNLILENSSLKKYRLLRKTAYNRHVYKLFQ